MATELIKVNENWNTLMCLKEMKKQASHVNQVHTIIRFTIIKEVITYRNRKSNQGPC